MRQAFVLSAAVIQTVGLPVPGINPAAQHHTANSVLFWLYKDPRALFIDSPPDNPCLSLSAPTDSVRQSVWPIPGQFTLSLHDPGFPGELAQC